jgi:hypothetical protein
LSVESLHVVEAAIASARGVDDAGMAAGMAAAGAAGAIIGGIADLVNGDDDRKNDDKKK